jgi:hypothetical protein
MSKKLKAAPTPTRHAALPWRVKEDGISIVGPDWREDKGIICRMNQGEYVPEAEKGNAAIIVQSVNAYAGLVAVRNASVHLLQVMNSEQISIIKVNKAKWALSDALKLAGEGE